MLTKAKFCECSADGKPSSKAFYVQFNPNEFTITEAVSDIAENGSDIIPNKGKKLSLQMKLFYNSYHSLSQTKFEDVRDSIRSFYPFKNTNITDAENLKKLAFIWGSITVCGVLSKMDVQYTMFSPAGIPIRAEVSLTMQGDYYGDKSNTSSFKESQEIKRYATFKDLLGQYKDPVLWKQEARKEGIKKPRP